MFEICKSRRPDVFMSVELIVPVRPIRSKWAGQILAPMAGMEPVTKGSPVIVRLNCTELSLRIPVLRFDSKQGRLARVSVARGLGRTEGRGPLIGRYPKYSVLTAMADMSLGRALVAVSRATDGSASMVRDVREAGVGVKKLETFPLKVMPLRVT